MSSDDSCDKHPVISKKHSKTPKKLHSSSEEEGGSSFIQVRQIITACTGYSY